MHLWIKIIDGNFSNLMKNILFHYKESIKRILAVAPALILVSFLWTKAHSHSDYSATRMIAQHAKSNQFAFVGQLWLML